MLHLSWDVSNLRAGLRILGREGRHYFLLKKPVNLNYRKVLNRLFLELGSRVSMSPEECMPYGGPILPLTRNAAYQNRINTRSVIGRDHGSYWNVT
jgi:hypothetical protein